MFVITLQIEKEHRNLSIYSFAKKVYQSLSPGEKSAIALNIVGGFQTGATKHIWNNEETEICELRGQVVPSKKSHVFALRIIGPSNGRGLNL